MSMKFDDMLHFENYPQNAQTNNFQFITILVLRDGRV